MPSKTLFYAVALFLFAIGFLLIGRAVKAPVENRPRFIRSGVGALAAAAGNTLMADSQMAGLLLMLAGVMLIFTSRTNTGRRL